MALTALHSGMADGATVKVCLVETTGAISPHTLRYVGHLAWRARGKGAHDGTKYGTLKTSARSFFRHHTQRLAKRAACGDVASIHDRVRSVRQCEAAARAADGASARA